MTRQFSTRVAFLFGLVVLSGCTSEPSKPRGNAGGESSGGSGGTTSAGSGGNGGTMPGSGSGGMATNRGAVIEFVEGPGEVPYALGENPYGIHGGAFLARSMFGNTITIENEPGEICISGSLEEVPNSNYSQYWGVEVGFNLNQTAPDDGAGGAGGVDGAAGAGGAGPDVAEPWLPGNVIGFSFVIEGPTINLVRFKALPAGFDPTLESSVYCKGMTPTSGAVNDALFSQMMQYCWNTGANVPIPTAAGLANLSWQLPADVAVGARPFDFCLKELRPILAE